jgi:hypothetical protein
MIVRNSNPTLEEQYKQQGECCYYCKDKVPYSLITRDHIKPVSKGHVLVNNKIYACRTCNNMKGDRSFEEFRSLMIKRCCDILSKVVKQNWMISDYQINMIKHHVRVINTVTDIINNGNTTSIKFT